MKRFLRIGAIFILLFILGCSSFEDQMPNYEKIADKITIRTADKLKSKKKLVLIGIGGGMMDDIKMMAMSFQFFHEVSLEEARELITYTINEYLSDINNNEEVRPYLQNYPFTADNIEIRIFVYGPDRRELPPEKIGYISSIDGILEYYTRSEDNRLICEETYDEALSKVAFSQGLEVDDQRTNEA